MGCSPHVWRQNGVGQELNRQKQRHPSVFRPTAAIAEPHLLLLAQDVAERALLERQLRQAQKMEAIGQLAAGVAHDFNNILTVTQGHVGLMQQELNGECPQTKSLEQVSKAASRAATLIRQLLMFSRKQVMQFRHLDLNDTLRNTVKMLERLVGEHVQIDFYPQESLPAIHADPSVVYRKWLDILSSRFSLFPLRPAWLDAFQLLPCALDFRHYLFDRRRPHERSGCFVPRLQELPNRLL